MQYQCKRDPISPRPPHSSLSVSDPLVRMLRIAPSTLPAKADADLRAAAGPTQPALAIPQSCDTPLAASAAAPLLADRPTERSLSRLLPEASPDRPKHPVPVPRPHPDRDEHPAEATARAPQNPAIPIVDSAAQDFTADAYASLGPLNSGTQ